MLCDGGRRVPPVAWRPHRTERAELGVACSAAHTLHDLWDPMSSRRAPPAHFG
jgi:hypothetical protein